VLVNAVWILEGGNKYLRLYRTQHKFVFISTRIMYLGDYYLGLREVEATDSNTPVIS
jgi:hypothetical protein